MSYTPSSDEDGEEDCNGEHGDRAGGDRLRRPDIQVQGGMQMQSVLPWEERKRAQNAMGSHISSNYIFFPPYP